jgi:outer membrane protein TolC
MPRACPVTTPAAALAATLLLATPAQALTLAEAIDAALAQRPGAELASARAAESAAIAAQADSLFVSDPALALQHYNDGVGSGDGGREWEAGISAQVWLPGQRAARRQVAAAAARQAGDAARERRWRVAGEVRQRLWDVLAAQRSVARQEQALADARLLEASVARRVAAGDLARPELLLARREALTREAALIEARGAREAARARWRAYTGLDEIPDDAAESEAPLAAIDATHPGLAALGAAAERAAAERVRARAERRANPSVSVGARHERSRRSEPWNDAIAVGVEVPLGLPAQSAPARSAAEYAYTEAAVALQQARLALEEELAAARAQLAAARTALESLRAADAAAQESLAQAQVAFDLGEAPLLTLLQIRAQALDAAARREEMELRVGRGIAATNHAQGQVPE